MSGCFRRLAVGTPATRHQFNQQDISSPPTQTIQMKRINGNVIQRWCSKQGMLGAVNSDRKVKQRCLSSYVARKSGDDDGGDGIEDVEFGVGEEVKRKVGKREVVAAAAVTVVLGVGNRVIHKLALVPLKQYPFFQAQLATFGNVFPLLKSRIFIIGGFGKFGRYVVEASAKAYHPTIALIRTLPTDPNSEDAILIKKFKNWGVIIVDGDFNINHDVIVKTMRKVDVVISCVSGQQVPDQVNITSAIQEAGNIKKFYPSEYAIDVDSLHDPVEPAATLFANKAAIRRLIEAEGIPHTFVVANGFAGRFWPNLAQVNPTSLVPDIQNVVAYGDGNSKVTATAEEDVATYIIKSVDDKATLNKILYLRPPANVISYNELFAIWEKMSGNMLQKAYITEDQLLHMIQDIEFPNNILLAVCYSVGIKDDYASYEIESSFGIEASQRYPEVKYKTVYDYFREVLTNVTSPVLSNDMEAKSSI